MLISQTTYYSQKNDSLFKYQSNKVKKVNFTKFFGVYIDDKLTWKDHISNVYKKTSMCIAIFNKANFTHTILQLNKTK